MCRLMGRNPKAILGGRVENSLGLGSQNFWMLPEVSSAIYEGFKVVKERGFTVFHGNITNDFCINERLKRCNCIWQSFILRHSYSFYHHIPYFFGFFF